MNHLWGVVGRRTVNPFLQFTKSELGPWLIGISVVDVVSVKSNKPARCIENAKFFRKIFAKQTACISCATQSGGGAMMSPSPL